MEVPDRYLVLGCLGVYWVLIGDAKVVKKGVMASDFCRKVREKRIFLKKMLWYLIGTYGFQGFDLRRSKASFSTLAFAALAVA